MKELNEYPFNKESKGIPYYRKLNDSWIIETVQHSTTYILRHSYGLRSTKSELPKTHKPNNSGGVSIDEWNKLIRLSRQYGNSYAHPRSGEIYHYVSESRRGKYSLRLRLSDKKAYHGLPRQPYHRQVNKPCSIKLKGEKKEFNDKSLWIGRPTKQWRGIWNMSKRSAHPKYNVWGNTRYNWGDSGIIKLQRITERCEWLAKKIRG